MLFNFVHSQAQILKLNSISVLSRIYFVSIWEHYMSYSMKHNKNRTRIKKWYRENEVTSRLLPDESSRFVSLKSKFLELCVYVSELKNSKNSLQNLIGNLIKPYMVFLCNARV